MEVANLAVKKALKLGASEAEAYVQKAKNVHTEFTERIESFKAVESIGMGLRVALGKKVAMYSTSISTPKDVEEAASKAVKIARVAPEDSDWKHVNRKFGKADAEGYYDSTLEDLDYGKVIEKLKASSKLITDYDNRVKPTRGLLTILTSNVSIVNSYGDSAERTESGVRVWIRTKAKETGTESTGNEHQEARCWKEIKFEELATKAAEKAVRFLNAKPISSCKTPVILRNQVAAGILDVLLSPAINADWVQKGRSPLANKLGKEIASSRITIEDDGLMQGGWGTMPFDDEGCPTQKTPVIQKGILTNFIYDSYTALKANTKSTGNAQRLGYWLRPQPAVNNLVLEKGHTKPDEIISETKNGVYVEETIGEWLSNPVSGNLNATISHGYLVKNGELTRPIKGVVISGSFYELLKSGFESIGNDIRNSANSYSPTVKLSGVTIAGE